MKKIVVITGANRGLGLSLCKLYSENGYKTFAICRSISNELSKLNVEIIDNVDLANEKDIEELPKKISCNFISLLIHNAGAGSDDDVITSNYFQMEYQFKVNALAPLFITKNLLNLFNPGSKIALISSRMSSIACNNIGASYAYRISKSALNMLGKNLSIDLREDKVAVGIYSPGIVDTDMLRALGNYNGSDPERVAAELLKLIERLSMENSGNFWDIDGQILPW